MCVQCVALGAGVCLRQRWIRAGSQQDHAGLQSSDQTAQHTPVARPAVSIISHTHWYIQPMHTNQLVRRQTRNKRLKKWFYIEYILHTHLHFYRPFRKLIKWISSNISWINVLKNNSWLLKTELKLYSHYQSWNECLVEITLHSFIIARLPKYLFNIFIVLIKYIFEYQIAKQQML